MVTQNDCGYKEEENVIYEPDENFGLDENKKEEMLHFDSNSGVQIDDLIYNAELKFSKIFFLNKTMLFFKRNESTKKIFSLARLRKSLGFLVFITNHHFGRKATVIPSE